MRRECQERFPRHRLQRKTLGNDPCMHHGTCVTHVPWCISGSLASGGGENVPGIPGACATRNFTYLIRGQCCWCDVILVDYYKYSLFLSTPLMRCSSSCGDVSNCKAAMTVPRLSIVTQPFLSTSNTMNASTHSVDEKGPINHVLIIKYEARMKI